MWPNSLIDRCFTTKTRSFSLFQKVVSQILFRVHSTFFEKFYDYKNFLTWSFVITRGLILRYCQAILMTNRNFDNAKQASHLFCLLLKINHSLPHVSLFPSFQQLAVHYKNIANDRIWTTDKMYRKQLLCRLSHNDCPNVSYYCIIQNS